MIKEQLITFETAKLAKDCGFDLTPRSWFACVDHKIPSYDISGKLLDFYPCRKHKINNFFIATTQAGLQAWLRNTKNIDVLITKGKSVEVIDKYCYHIPQISHASPFFDTYEDALEAGLAFILKLEKNGTINYI